MPLCDRQTPGGEGTKTYHGQAVVVSPRHNLVPVAESDAEGADGNHFCVGELHLSEEQNENHERMTEGPRRRGTGRLQSGPYLVKVAGDSMNVAGQSLQIVERVLAHHVARAENVLDFAGNLCK